jgi:hypothetical protein
VSNIVNIEDRRHRRPLTDDERHMLRAWATSEDREIHRSVYCNGLLYRTLGILTLGMSPLAYDNKTGITTPAGVHAEWKLAGWYEVGPKVVRRVFRDLVRLGYLVHLGDEKYMLIPRTNEEYRRWAERQISLRDGLTREDLEGTDILRWIDQWTQNGGEEALATTGTLIKF